VGGLSCDDPDASFNVYTGGYFNEWLGAEIGYIHMGNADRFGGEQRAQGINLSLVGRLPLADRFALTGKLGTTYGRTRTSGTGIATGNDSGWGKAYGVGVSYDFTPNWTGVVQWESHDFHFATGKDPVRTTSVGLQYRF
jgi:opacity protein-like surface antigen